MKSIKCIVKLKRNFHSGKKGRFKTIVLQNENSHIPIYNVICYKEKDFFLLDSSNIWYDNIFLFIQKQGKFSTMFEILRNTPRCLSNYTRHLEVHLPESSNKSFIQK